jgi:hypothetical protein
MTPDGRRVMDLLRDCERGSWNDVKASVAMTVYSLSNGLFSMAYLPQNHRDRCFPQSWP